VKFDAFVRLTRIEHALMLCVAVLIGEVVALGRFPSLGLAILTFLPPFFIEMSAFAINDFFDVEADRRNGRTDRPLVSGEATVGEALAISAIGMVVGISTAWLINYPCFLIALIFGALAFFYSYKLKDVALVGNIYIALTMAIPFVFGNMAVSDSISPSITVLALIAFVTGLGREVMGTVRDIEGDRLRPGARTLPMIIGTRMALIYSSLLYVLAALMSIVPFILIPQYKNDLNYLVPVAICDVILLYIAARSLSNSKEFLESARKLSLAGMAFGLFGFFLGACY